MKLWNCNFNSQLANALIIEGDYESATSCLECGLVCATQISYPELQVLCVICTGFSSFSFVASASLFDCLGGIRKN